MTRRSCGTPSHLPRISASRVRPRASTSRSPRSRTNPDPELALERKIALKYTGSHVDVEPPGTARYAATVIVEKITHQLGH